MDEALRKTIQELLDEAMCLETFWRDYAAAKQAADSRPLTKLQELLKNQNNLTILSSDLNSNPTSGYETKTGLD